MEREGYWPPSSAPSLPSYTFLSLLFSIHRRYTPCSGGTTFSVPGIFPAWIYPDALKVVPILICPDDSELICGSMGDRADVINVAHTHGYVTLLATRLKIY